MKTSKRKPCDKCPVWDALVKNRWVTTRTIGGRISKGVKFKYLPKSNEIEIQLPRSGRKPIQGYPKRFSEAQFKVMCCRFSYVTDQNESIRPSDFLGNHHFNRPHWTQHKNDFSEIKYAPPYVVAVVRKVLEDNPELDHIGYCNKI